MKILAFTDIHGDPDCIEKILKKKNLADILVCCGDFSVFGISIYEILRIFSLSGKQIIIIHGNHEEGIDLSRICKRFKNIKYLHKDSFDFNGYTFFAYGGGGFKQNDINVIKCSNSFKKKLDKKKIILLTHAPPYNTKLDYLSGIGHVGSKSVRKIVEDLKPVLHLCGHLHETFNKKDKINKTVVINPGCEGMIIEI